MTIFDVFVTGRSLCFPQLFYNPFCLLYKRPHFLSAGYFIALGITYRRHIPFL